MSSSVAIHPHAESRGSAWLRVRAGLRSNSIALLFLVATSSTWILFSSRLGSDLQRLTIDKHWMRANVFIPNVGRDNKGNTTVLGDADPTTHQPATTPPFTPRPCMSDLCTPSVDGCCCRVQEEARGGGTPLLAPDLSSVPAERALVERYLATGVQPGGQWEPTGCTSEQRLAVLLPYRNRFEHLLVFLAHMHGYLQRQNIAYTIFVVDQADELPFNRAMLFNVGIVEAGLEALATDGENFTCAAMHDVDNLPVDPLLSYWCESTPVHMSAHTDRWSWGLPYQDFAGGVAKQLTSQLHAMNGLANVFWGWGGEDDDLLLRWYKAKYQLRRPQSQLGHYATVELNHRRDQDTPEYDRMKLLATSAERSTVDGLSNLKYRLLSKNQTALYTLLRVELQRNGEFEYLYK